MYLPRFAYEATAALSDVRSGSKDLPRSIWRPYHGPGSNGGHIIIIIMAIPPVVKYAFELGFTHIEP